MSLSFERFKRFFMTSYVSLKYKFFRLIKKPNSTSINYFRLKLILKFILNKIYISTKIGDIKNNDYFNAYRWDTTRGDSSCCC